MTVLFCFHFNEKNNGGVKSLLDMLEVFLEKGVRIIAAFPFKDGSVIEHLVEQGVKSVVCSLYKMGTTTKCIHQKQIQVLYLGDALNRQKLT